MSMKTDMRAALRTQSDGWSPMPPERFFRGWRIDHGCAMEWIAESPDWGIRVEAKTLRGLVRKMAREGLKWFEREERRQKRLKPG
jgi:hypothetical protein